MDEGIARALRGLDEKDVYTLAAEVAKRIHGLPATYSDTPLVFKDCLARRGKIFVDSVSGNTIGLTWALPRGAGWARGALIDLTVGRGPQGGYSAATIVKSWVDGKHRRYGTGPCERETIAGAVDAVFCELFMSPQMCFLRPYTAAIPDDSGYRSVRRWGLILTNLAIFAWLFIPFKRYLDGAPDNLMFQPVDALVLVGIISTGVGIILLARRRYLDSVHAIARQGYIDSMTLEKQAVRREDNRVPITVEELEELENEKLGLGWWLCMFAAVILFYLVLGAFSPFIR